MAYEFGNLSHADCLRQGPTEGIDGRHSKGGNAIILQAKHYAGSGYSTPKSEIKRESGSIKRLSPIDIFWRRTFNRAHSQLVTRLLDQMLSAATWSAWKEDGI